MFERNCHIIISMEGQFPHPGYLCFQDSQHFYSAGQKCVQQQWSSSQMYSAYPKVMSQCSRQTFHPQPQHLSSREKIFSPPPITFERNHPAASGHPHSSQFATRVPSSFDFFNHMQRNPMYNQLQEILAEECFQYNHPSTLIQTVTQDYNNMGFSVSCQQKFQIHRTQPPTDNSCLVNPLPESILPANRSHSVTTSQCLSNRLSSGSCDQPLAPLNTSSSSSTESTSPPTYSYSRSRRALFRSTTPDAKDTSSSSHQEQKSPVMSPISSHLNSSGSSPSSIQEVDSGIYVDTSISFQTDNGVDLLQQASDLCGITEEDIAPLQDDPSPISHQKISSTVSHPAPRLPANEVLHHFDTTRHETVFNSTSSSHSSLSDYSPIRGEEILTITTPEEVQPSNQLKRKREEEEEEDQENKRNRTELTAQDPSQVLNSWYQSHITYPYPSDAEVQELVTLSGLTRKQVKKWMANKRVRCFNTLSITGNQHPIKFKQIKKKETPAFQPMAAESREVLNQWYEANLSHPYPTDTQREELAAQTGLTVQQVKRWLANKRSRANNTRRQIPNYFIQKFPEYSQHVEMVSRSREFLRMSKKRQLDDALDCLNRM